MIKQSWFIAPALALCFLLTGCFTSDLPLFDQRGGSALLGVGDVKVTGHGGDEKDRDDVGVLHWKDGVYIDVTDKAQATMSFHRLPGTWPWDGWYVGETQMDEDASKGYIYELYRKTDDRLLVFNISCHDLTDAEAQKTHMARTDSGVECKATRQSDLAAAMRLLIKRKKPESYWTYAPAPPPAQPPSAAAPAPPTP